MYVENFYVENVAYAWTVFLSAQYWGCVYTNRTACGETAQSNHRLNNSRLANFSYATPATATNTSREFVCFRKKLERGGAVAARGTYADEVNNRIYLFAF